MRHSLVIGSGIVGLCTALYLQERGRRVTLLDPQAPGSGTSSGNAGLICTGSVHPEAMPGIWKELPGMLMQRLAPVTLRPAYLPHFAPWLRRFLAASSPARAEAASGAIHALSAKGLEYLQPLVTAARATELIREDGLLYVFETHGQFARAKAKALYLDRLSVPYEFVDSTRLQELEPALRPGLAGGMLMKRAAHTLSPLRLCEALFRRFQSRGGSFRQTRVTGFQSRDSRVTGVCAEETQACDEVFVTCGAWSCALARLLGSEVPLDTERGYHEQLPDPGVQLRRPILFPGRAFAATNMLGGLRLAGTVEFAGLDAEPDYRRARVLAEHAAGLFPGLNARGSESWMGYRPSLPDSLPVVSASPHFENVYFGFGHGHLGLTQAAVTGAALATLAVGARPPVDLGPYRVDRRF